MKRRLVVLPDSVEQDAGASDVARASETGLDLGEPPHVAFRGRMGCIKRLEELGRIAQLLEVDSEIVLRIDVELPEMRAAPERLAVQSRQNLTGERRHRLRQDGQGFAVDLIAPAAPFHQMPQREQETAATGIGEHGLQGAVARFALLFDRLAQAAEVDIRGRRDQAT